MAGKYPVVLRASISDAITSGPVNTRPGRRVRSLQRNSIFGVRGRSDEFGGRAGRNHSDRVSPSPQIGVACTVRVHRTVCDPFHGQPILGQLTKVRDLLGRRGPTGERSSKRPRSFDYSLRFREGGWAEVAVGWSGRSSSAAGLTSAALSAGVERRRSASFADSAISSAGPDARGADRVVFGQLLAAGLLLMAYDIPGRDQPFNGSTRREHGTTITDQPFFVSSPPTPSRKSPRSGNASTTAPASSSRSPRRLGVPASACSPTATASPGAITDLFVTVT